MCLSSKFDIFTKFSKIVCLTNVNMTDVTASYGTLPKYVSLFFNHNWQHFMSLVLVFTNISQTVCLINTYNLVCQYAKYTCRLWKRLPSYLNMFIWEFLYFETWIFISSSNFHKLRSKVICIFGTFSVLEILYKTITNKKKHIYDIVGYIYVTGILYVWKRKMQRKI